MVYRCGHNLDGSTPEPSDFPPERQMPRSTGLCSRCQADTYPAHHPLGGGGFQASEISKWVSPEGKEYSLGIDKGAGESFGISAFSDMYFDEDGDLRSSTTAKTYGGISRGSLEAKAAEGITLHKLLDQFASLPKVPPMPPYYRCHPSTYVVLTKTLCNKPDRPDWLPEWINFAGVRVVQDPKVTPGEFWPPEDEEKPE